MDIGELQLETRKGRKIPNELLPEQNPAALRAARDLAENQWFPGALRFRSISATYNCVGMVVATRRVWVQPADLMQILIDDGFQKLAGPEYAEAGDVVIYRDDRDNEPTHVGVVVRKKLVLGSTEDFLVVLSKWGRDGEYEHASRTVPKVYGNPAEYWTDRRNP